MKNSILVFAFCLLNHSGFSQQDTLKAFPLSAVRLSESPFKQAQQTDLKYMLALNPDRLLAPFRKEAGLSVKADNYGNWEATGLDGHLGGHYISALANMYAATGNQQVLQRLNYMINQLDSCQQQNGNGYIGGVPGGEAMWKDIAAGKIDAGSFALNGKWVPWYNLHKLYAGLIDAYQIAGNQQARRLLLKLSDWCLQLTHNLTDKQMQTMLRTEQGGMNEVFADVAALTGDKRYLEMARRFSHQQILQPLEQHKDALTSLHANTQIPKVIGFMRVAEVAGDPQWSDAAGFFWKTVVDNRTVSIGGNSVREHFHPADNFSSMVESREGPETCNTYNMLKLTKHLFLDGYTAAYMDYYERALYNHILSSQHPDGGFVYFTPMRPRHYRVYSQPQEGFWCCVGSGLENHGKYGEMIYAHSDKDLFVNLYIPSTLQWKEKGMTLVQDTRFPQSETVKFTLKLHKPQRMALQFRYPSWVKEGALQISVNKQKISITQKPSSYVAVERLWKTGDVVTLTLPMHTTVEQMPDHSAWASFLYGPLVLAAVTDTTDLQGLKADDSRMGHIANGPLYPIEDAPLVVSAASDLSTAIRPVPGKSLTFTASDLVYPDKYKKLEMVPFYTIHDARYMLYWPVTTPEQLQTRMQNIKKEETARLTLEAQTVDQVAPGEQQPESDHHFQGEKTESGVFNERHWRHATGWFSYDLKDPKKEAKMLRITCYGKDANRRFAIYANDQLVANVVLDGTRGEQFVDLDYPLPAAITQRSSGEKLVIRFVAEPNSTAGGIYGVRLLK